MRRWVERCLLFMALPLAVLLLTSNAHAQTVIKPEFLLLVDTSGSMSTSTGTGINSCGYTRNRINDAACVVRNVADGVGDAVFGFGTFTMSCVSTPATGDHYGTAASGSCGMMRGAPPASATASA